MAYSAYALLVHYMQQEIALSSTLCYLPTPIPAHHAQDGGVRRGTDVLKALALGADCVLLGRPVLYGLAGRIMNLTDSLLHKSSP